jgi:hypothetical protein
MSDVLQGKRVAFLVANRGVDGLVLPGGVANPDQILEEFAEGVHAERSDHAATRS